MDGLVSLWGSAQLRKIDFKILFMIFEKSVELTRLSDAKRKFLMSFIFYK